MSTVDKIKGIEEEMARTQKNKATNAHLGLLKAKLAKLKHELIEGPKKGGSSLGGTGFEVNKMGDARVGLVGEYTGQPAPSPSVLCRRYAHLSAPSLLTVCTTAA